METLIYLGFLFLALFLGAGAAFTKLIPARYSSIVDRLLGWCLYALLFSMGIKTGLIEDIGTKLSMIGATAVAFAAFTVVGSAVLVLTVGFIADKTTKTAVQEQKTKKAIEKKFSLVAIIKHLQEPLILICIVVAGALLSAGTNLFSWFSDTITEWLLYVLLFLVGIQMVHGKTDIKSLLKDPVALTLPIMTVVGTLAGALCIPLFFDISLSESLAVGSGFGWYSLSGILIADLGDPILGSIAFLSNLFRESLAFITIPLLAGYGRKRAAISVCGATSMDVTLPMIEKYCGVHYVPLSLAHGILLTLIVPFLVPVLYTSGI